MANSHIYVPVVKGKMNDLKAVARLSASDASLLKPFVELMPWNPKKGLVDQHLEKFLDYVSDYLGGVPIFVDMYGFLPGQAVANGKSAVLEGFHKLLQRGRKVTPAYGLNRDDELWQGLKAIVKKNANGFCFRIDIDDLDDAAEETWNQVIERSAQLDLAPSDVDLLIDLRDVREAQVDKLKDLVIEFTSLNAAVSQYRSVIVAGSSALKTVTSVKLDGHLTIHRNELLLWTALRRDLDESVCLLYGDYGVVHPHFSDGGSSKYQNAKVRYTSGSSIHYFRGHGLLHPAKDYQQYRKLAQKVRAHGAYKGSQFCFGDLYVANCATSVTPTPGSPQTWVLAEMNHHLTSAVRQMSKLVEVVQEISNDDEVLELLEST